MESDGDLIVGGLDVVGDSSEGDMVLGRGRRRGARVPTPRWMRATTSQGVSRPQEELDYLPFNAVSIPNASETVPIPAGFAGFLLAEPQRPFRGERLVLSAINSLGADISSGVVIDPAIYVGAVQVGAAQGGAPFSAFAATAFGVRLSLPAAGQGTKLKVFFRLGIPVPTLTTFFLSGVLYGRAMR